MKYADRELMIDSHFYSIHCLHDNSAIIVTTSSRPERLTRYLAVGDVHLSDEDIHAIDKAGKKGEEKDKIWAIAKTVGKVGVLGGLGVWGLYRLVL